MLNIIGLLERPDRGVVRLFEEAGPHIGSVRANKLLRTRLSYLFQNFAATVDYNLEIPLIYSKKTRKGE